MFKSKILIPVLLITVVLNAQQSYYHDMRDTNSLRVYMDLVNVEGNELNINEVKGSPYLEEGFDEGIIYRTKDNKVLIGKAQIRYDIYNDQFQILTENDQGEEEIISLVKNDNFSYNVFGKRFVHGSSLTQDSQLTDNYFQVIPNSKNQVYKRYSVIFVEGKKSDNSLTSDRPAKFIQSEELFFKLENRLTKISNKKDILNVKTDEKTTAIIKKTIENNSLKFKKKTIETDLVTLVKMMD